MRLYRPEELDAARRGVYDSIVGGARGSGSDSLVDDDGRLSGPFNHMLIDPVVGSAVDRLGVALRFEADLSPRIREITILEVAKGVGSDFEWQAHARLGRAIGLTDDELADILADRASGTMSSSEAAVRRLVSALIVDGEVPREIYELAENELGDTALYDVVMLAGFYVSVSFVLATYAIPLPDGVVPVLRPRRS